MDRFAKERFFTAILSSEVLVPHLEQNPELAELMKVPDHPDIHYYETYAVAKELLPALKRRFDHMNSAAPNFDAMRQLVTFLEGHPDSQIHNVTFNCLSQHYGVRCGQVGNELRVICVMTGGHIPNDLLGESTK